LGEIYQEQNNHKKVVKIYQSILDKDADNVQAMVELGSWYYTKNHHKKARQAFLGIVKKLKKYPQFIKKIAAHFYDKKQNEIAVFALKTFQKDCHSQMVFITTLEFITKKTTRMTKLWHHINASPRTLSILKTPCFAWHIYFRKKKNFKQALIW
jgi:hypothetical protein